MTSLHCNNCGFIYSSSEVTAKIKEFTKSILIFHGCPHCKFKNETVFLSP